MKSIDEYVTIKQLRDLMAKIVEKATPKSLPNGATPLRTMAECIAESTTEIFGEQSKETKFKAHFIQALNVLDSYPPQSLIDAAIDTIRKVGYK